MNGLTVMTVMFQLLNMILMEILLKNIITLQTHLSNSAQKVKSISKIRVLLDIFGELLTKTILIIHLNYLKKRLMK